MILECSCNLRMVALACALYAADNGGNWPREFRSLLEDPGVKGSGGWCFVCPATRHRVGALQEVDSWTDFVLVPQGVAQPGKDAILVLEPLANHSGIGAHVAYADGRVLWLPRDPYDSVTSRYRDVLTARDHDR